MNAVGSEGQIRDQYGADVLVRLRKARNDPWYFCSNCVFTLDQADKNNPIKKYPSDTAMGPYLKLYTRIWQTYPFIAVPKSRRMFMSWQNIALYLWDSMFHVGRSNALVSKKEDDANELLKKALFIYDHVPENFIPKALLPKIEAVFGHVRFPEINSELRGFPQGADQLRQFTFSGLMFDELAFWDSAQEAYAASFPTIEGGGRMTAISSPGPGFFKKLVFDQLDEEKDAA